MSASQRSEIWKSIWTERGEERADWNGFEACFDSIEDYQDWTAQVAAVVSHHLDLGVQDVVLDLGCGTGRMAALVAPSVQRVIALDYSETVLAVARSRRQLPNIVFEHADLNDWRLPPTRITKAYTVGSLMYLDSEAAAFGLLRRLNDRGIAVAAMDLPDESVVDERPRAYDTAVFSHLRFSVTRLLGAFPGGRVERNEFPGYVHGPSRFNFYLVPPPPHSA